MKLEVPSFEPEHFLFLDWETYWDADYTLKKMPTSDYVRDPRFEAIGVSINDGEQTVWLSPSEFQEWAKTVRWEKVAVGCHHAHFDGLILSHHYGIHPAVFFCTMSMARTYGIDGGVSLGSLAEHFGVGQKGDEVTRAKGKHLKDFTPEELAAYAAYGCNDIDLTRMIFDAMVAQGFPEAELWLIDSTVKMFTNPMFVLNERMLEEYLVYERERKAALLARIGMDRKTIGANATLAKAFQELGVEAPMKDSPKARNPDGSKKQIYAFSKTDPGMQELLEHPDDDVRWLAEARIAVKSTLNETRTERFLKMGRGGATCPVYLNYSKAHTYRWSGGDKRNWQNLQRVNDKKPNTGVIKKALEAPPGFKVVAADSGAIEARGTAWLARHSVLVAGFQKGVDLYSDFAGTVYGRPVFRKRKKDHPEFNPDDESAGGLGKVAILGLGYQMGWPKFATTLLAGPMGADPIRLGEKDADTMGVDVNKFACNERKVKRMRKLITRLDEDALLVHCAVADKIVRTYREVHSPIVDLWETMEQVIQTMEEIGEDEQFSFGPNECLTVVRHGIILPNGLTLRYPGLRKSGDTVDEEGEVIRGGYSYLGQYGKIRVHTYGGAMTENVIQALSRIVIGEQMLSLKAKYGYDTKLVTHDEIATIVPDREAAAAEWRLVEEMKIAPKWAEGWPLTAEGGHAQSYGDC